MRRHDSWCLVRALERTTRRPTFWWRMVGSAALGRSLIGSSYLADGVDALALGGFTSGPQRGEAIDIARDTGWL
jgi:hypothetical protein